MRNLMGSGWAWLVSAVVLVSALACGGSTSSGGPAAEQGGTGGGGQAGSHAGTSASGTAGAAGDSGHAGSASNAGSAGDSSAGGTGGTGGTGEMGGVSLRRDIVPLFDRSCALAGCHTAPATSYIALAFGPSATFETSALHSELVSTKTDLDDTRRLVTPGDPDGSVLLRKLRGSWSGLSCESEHKCGKQMPLEAAGRDIPKLTSDEIQTIEDWISEGATDN